MVDTQKSLEQSQFDLIVAGGGLAGCLSAARILSSHPHLKILILEKEVYLGGRIRSHQWDNEKSLAWGYGFSAISQDMFDFWLKSSSYIDDFDLNDYVEKKIEDAAILAGSKFSKFKLEEFFGAKSARAMGGLAASKSWTEVEACLDRFRKGKTHKITENVKAESSDSAEDNLDIEETSPNDEDRGIENKAFANLWKGTRKDAAMIVAEPLALASGIVDIWSSSTKAISELVEQSKSANIQGNWVKALHDMMQKLQDKFVNHLLVKNSCRIVGAQWEKDLASWSIRTECGEFKASTLLVAQTPWACFDWLDKSLATSPVVNIPSKTRPVSLVCLSEKLKFKETEAKLEQDLVLIPSEQSLAIFDIANEEIIFQMALDFEFSLQSLNVVKAIKALKRARRKLHAAMPELEMGTEHIALVPVAWPLSPAASDMRVLSKIEKNLNQKHLFFCGDTYAFEFKSNSAVVKSVLKFQADFSKLNGVGYRHTSQTSEVELAT